jgi:hypothetical protein
MAEKKSVVFLTMPTSGSGSLWRLITAVGGSLYKPIKISEVLENSGKGSEISRWPPEPVGHLYMYNTPHYVNSGFADPEAKLITNFRDPRDLACNQFHWAQQHPIMNRSEGEIAAMRRAVAERGIDDFVAETDNNNLFNSLRALAPRLSSHDPNVLYLSYSQLCLDFDNLIQKLIAFLDVSPVSVPHDLLERERTVNLDKNPHWIGRMWTGTDIAPGRYRRELSKATISIIDKKYHDSLKFVRAFELPHLRPLLATEAERAEMERVFVGRDNELFLRNDANDTLGQITGRIQLSLSDLTRIAMAHRSRQLFGTTMAHYDYAHALIPSKEVAHRKLLPESIGFEQHGGRPIQQYLNQGLCGLWKPFYEPTVLEPHQDKRFYPATDSHWNHQGAFRYLGAFLNSKLPKLATRMGEIPLRHFPGRQQGDLGLKLEIPPEGIEITAPQRAQARLIFENGINNEGCIRWYRNPAVTDGSRAFIMHDSFTLWLLGVLPELFSEVVFFHGTVFDYEFVQRHAPDTILCLQTERFFTRVPETGGDMLRYVAKEEEEKKAVRKLADFLASEPRFAVKSVSEQVDLKQSISA